MEKAPNIIFILLISAFFALPFSVLALEIQYPILPGASNPTTLVRFVNYLFIFIIFLGVAIATLQLILAGAKFIWGSSKPETIKEARQQAVAALFGLGILLGSFLILRTINPQLTRLSLPALKSFPETWPPPGPQDSIFRGDLMERIKEMAEGIKNMLSENDKSNVKKSSEDIKNATKNCDCSGAASLCSCDEPGQTGKCQAQKCYVAPNAHPCKDDDREQIKENQKKLIFFSDAILYYKNRTEEEINDLKENINVIDKQLSWYLESIKTAEENEKKSKTPADKNFWQTLDDHLKKGYEKSLKEKNGKIEIGKQLADLQKYLDSFSEPLKKIRELPEKCESEVENKCQPSCKDKKEEGYGCYEAPLGCQPDNCKSKSEKPEDKNPCPQKEIDNTAKNIGRLIESATKVLSAIIQIINSLKQV